MIPFPSRLILIAEKSAVYQEFPTPLINRLEKHFVLYSSVLEDWQTHTLTELEEWIKDFSHVHSSNFRYGGIYFPLTAKEGVWLLESGSNGIAFAFPTRT
jgi:hypothetical protein